MRPVRADCNRSGPVEAIDAGDAVLVHLDEGQGSRRLLPAEHRHRVVTVAGDVDVCPARTDRDGCGPLEAIDSTLAVPVHFDEGQPPCRRVPAEHCQLMLKLAGHVDMRAVGADGHRCGSPDAVPLHFDEVQCPRRPVPAEHRHRIVHEPSGVDVRPIRADGHRCGSPEAVHVTDAVPLHFDEGQCSRRPVPAEHCQRTVHMTNGIDMRPVRADRHRCSSLEAIDSALAIPVHFDEGQEGRAGGCAEHQQ